jgi:hypothetical protein
MNTNKLFELSDDIPIPAKPPRGRKKYAEDAPLVEAGFHLVINERISCRTAARNVLHAFTSDKGNSPQSYLNRIAKKIRIRVKASL